MRYITESEIDGISSETGKALASEPKTTIVIRPEGGETYWEGGVNGHFFRIRTNESVAVPKSLAVLIAQSAAVQVECEAKTRAFRRSGGKKVS